MAYERLSVAEKRERKAQELEEMAGQVRDGTLRIRHVTPTPRPKPQESAVDPDAPAAKQWTPPPSPAQGEDRKLRRAIEARDLELGRLGVLIAHLIDERILSAAKIGAVVAMPKDTIHKRAARGRKYATGGEHEAAPTHFVVSAETPGVASCSPPWSR
jgi:hypothetical protein